MKQIQRLLLASTLAAITVTSGCNQQGGPAPRATEATSTRPPAVDAAAIARADAQISQPAWLRERLPEHTAAYARIPSLWGTLSAPDGRPLDAALVADQHVKIIAALRKAAQNDPTLSMAGAGPLLNVLLGDQASPIEMALIDSSDGVTPFSRALVTVVLDEADVAALNARIAHLNGNGPSPLQAPVDANGDATLQQMGALHFDAADHRLFLELGNTASALTLQQDLAQLKSTHAHPMQDAEKEIDASGQGLFVWLSMKGLNSQLEAQLQDQPPDGLLRNALEQTRSVALGWGTQDGHGALQLQVMAPQARLLGYLSRKAGDIDLKTSGAPDWAMSLALPGGDNLQQIHDHLDQDFGPGVRAQYEAGGQRIRNATGVNPDDLARLFGPQLVYFSDSNGRFIAVQVRDSKSFYASLDALTKRFGWRNTVTKSGPGEIHHLHIVVPEDGANAAPDPQIQAWTKLYARIGLDYYWIDEGGWFVYAKVPQPLIDRLASKPEDSLGDWLRKTQSYDSEQTLFGTTVTTHDVQREVYYTYLGLLDDLGGALGTPIDLTTLPTAKQLGLPTQGLAGVDLRANDQRIALRLNYEQSPAESALAGGDNTMTTVAVIGILAAIAIPAYQDYTIRSQVSEGAALSEGAKTAVAEYYVSHKRMPLNNTEAGLAAPDSITGSYASSVNVSDGRIVVMYDGAQANAAIKGSVLVFVPVADASGVKWICTTSAGTTINVKYRPTVCRP